MLLRIIPLNCREKEYAFNLSVITDDRWSKFVQDIVNARVYDIKNVKINGAKIVVRDNKAKVKLFYQDVDYHEVVLYFDEFGRISKEYKDVVSQIWQDMMSEYYGNKYVGMLNNKLGVSNIETIKN